MIRYKTHTHAPITLFGPGFLELFLAEVEVEVAVVAELPSLPLTFNIKKIHIKRTSLPPGAFDKTEELNVPPSSYTGLIRIIQHVPDWRVEQQHEHQSFPVAAPPTGS